MTEKLSDFTVSTPTLAKYIAGANAGSPNQRYLLNDITKITEIYLNIKVDFGARGDGFTDDSQAFLNFQAFAQTQNPNPVVLVIPPGTYVTQGAVNGAVFWTGITDLTIFGYGATLTDFNRGGVIPQQPLGTGSAKIQSTAVGDTSVTCLVLAQAAQFKIGDWIVVSSIEMQGASSYPPNWYHFEFVVVTNVAGAVISITPQLRYAHLSTYPDTSDNVNYYCGGPASIFLLDQTWAQTVRLYGLTLLGNLIAICAQVFHCTDVTFAGTDMAPTQSDLITLNSCNFLATAVNPIFEVDKVISSLIITDCFFLCNLQNVSASVGEMVLDGCAVLAGLNSCCSKITSIRNSHIDTLGIGGGFGPGGALQVNGCRVDTLLVSYAQTITISDVSFANGTFTFANWLLSPSGGDIIRFVPGQQCFLTGTGDFGTPPDWGFPFVVTGIRQVGSDIKLDTTLTSLPTYSITGGGTATLTKIVGHPASRISGRANQGPADMINLSQTSGELPLFSFGRMLMTGNSNNTAVPLNALGAITQLSVNVIRAYSGAKPTLNLNILGSSGGMLLDQTTAAWTRTSPTVNLKTAGLRVITQAAVTGNQAGDVLSAWGTSNWLNLQLSLSFDQDISGDTFAQWPLVDVQVTTDQGINAIPLQFVGTTQILQ